MSRAIIAAALLLAACGGISDPGDAEPQPVAWSYVETYTTPNRAPCWILSSLAPDGVRMTPGTAPEPNTPAPPAEALFVTLLLPAEESVRIYVREGFDRLAGPASWYLRIEPVECPE